MVLIFRGAGIVVPIVLFIAGWIVSFWYKDSRIGNPDFMGWTLFYTAIVCLLLGLAFLGGEEETNEQGQRTRKPRPHFFFIPVILWAPIFGGISAYLLLGSGKANDPVKEELVMEEQVVMPSGPIIHFYNPTEDTLDYLIYTKGGVSDQEPLEPFSSVTMSAPEKSYVLGALNTKGEATMTLPYYEAYDAKLYEKVKDGDRTVEQRLIRPLSAATNDYEDNWMLLDGTYNMILVDVTELYDLSIKKDKVAKIDWMKKIKSRHAGTELIELSIAPTTADGSVYVCEPNTYLPKTNSKERSVYLILVHSQGTEPTNDFIKNSIEGLIE